MARKSKGFADVYAKHNAQTHEVWWIADTKEEAQMVARLGYKATYAQSNKAEQLFKDADVYVTENFRESYPASLNEDAIILNLWHGVGLKHIELGLGPDSTLAESIVRKYARNYALYRNNLKFLATSPAMESHFEADMGLTEDQLFVVDTHVIVCIVNRVCGRTKAHLISLMISMRFICLHQRIALQT
ncbi:Uncharacterised protein [Weissella viridescens]|uniref:Uncharacterized protein n=1 Tax=Weissella viridescens TaxID=1629 RepID=A0A380P1B7_WEIVI|nr:Uncharacterised protein [Weissella viridescens]